MIQIKTFKCFAGCDEMVNAFLEEIYKACYTVREIKIIPVSDSNGYNVVMVVYSREIKF